MCIIPALRTFQKAIRKFHFTTWPGINKINFEKIVTNTIPTSKGHMDQEGSNLQSTKKIKNNNNEDDDFFLKMELVKKHNVFRPNRLIPPQIVQG